MKKYFINAKTHKIHIDGYCPHSKIKPYNTIYFNTEDEAVAYDGRAAGLCIVCAKRRLREETGTGGI